MRKKESLKNYPRNNRSHLIPREFKKFNNYNLINIMDAATIKDLKKVRNVLINSNDERFNYAFHQQDDIDTYLDNSEFILTMDKYDYGLVKEPADEYNLAKLTPVSLNQVSSLEEGELWYRMKYPDLPDEYHGIMARYSFGELLTKKEVKNTIKKYKKKKKPPPVGLEFKEGSFWMDFS